MADGWRSTALRMAAALVATMLLSPLTPTGPVGAGNPDDPTEPSQPRGPAGGTCAPVDVALVLDSSTSMNSAIRNVKDQLVSFLDVVEEASGGDYRIGVIDFGREVEVHVPFSDRNRDEAAAAIPNLYQNRGNSFDPEAWDQALATAVHNRATTDIPGEDAARWHVGDFSTPWRADANKLVVLVTDALPAGWDDRYDQVDADFARQTAREAADAGIKVSTFFVPSTQSQPDAAAHLEQIAGFSGGSYVKTTTSGENLALGLDLAVRTCGSDTDGDGLFDSWETEGIDHNNDGTIDVDLPAMGADPNHKDLFVQINWMTAPRGWCAFGVCHGGAEGFPAPSVEALRRVGQAFADAPVPNPDGEPGIRVHFDAGASTPDEFNTGGDTHFGGPLDPDEWLDPLYSNAKDEPAVDSEEAAFIALLERTRPEVRRASSTWALYAPRINSKQKFLGWAVGIPSDSFVVSGAYMDSVNKEAITVMHELGHTLGLGHGGADHILYKPNYPSIMNYSHSNAGGLAVDGKMNILDYSRWLTAPLDEAEVDETAGVTVVGEDPPVLAVYSYCPIEGQPDKLQRQPRTTGMPIDWNCDGDTTDTGYQTQLAFGDRDGYSVPEVLTGYDDWANLSFTGGLRGGLVSDAGDEVDEDDFTDDAYDATPKPYAVEMTGGGQMEANPGAVTFAVRVRNAGEEPDTYTLEVSTTEGAADVMVESVELSAGDDDVIGVTLDIPDGASDPITVVLTATSDAEPTAAAQTTFTIDPTDDDIQATVQGQVTVEPPEVDPGGTVTLSGAGFVPGDAVAVSGDGSLFDPIVVAADTFGEVSVEVRISTDSDPGTTQVGMAAAGAESPTTIPPEGDEDDATVEREPRLLSGELIVNGPTEAPAPTTVSGPAGDEDNSGVPWAAIAAGVGVIVLVIAAIVGVVLARRSRRRRGPPPLDAT